MNIFKTLIITSITYFIYAEGTIQTILNIIVFYYFWITQLEYGNPIPFQKFQKRKKKQNKNK